jgi:hypothetical protein
MTLEGIATMSETNFFWDQLSDNILQERDETGTVTAEYTTEPGLYGNLTSQNRSGAESQYHFDPLGSTLALTNDSQQVTDTNAYSAFGELTEYTGGTVNPFQYIGQKGYYSDEQANEYIVRRRTLSAWGRWRSIDPEQLLGTTLPATIAQKQTDLPHRSARTFNRVAAARRGTNRTTSPNGLHRDRSVIATFDLVNRITDFPMPRQPNGRSDPSGCCAPDADTFV